MTVAAKEDSAFRGASDVDGPRPSFFLVGAPKAGTTSFYHYLGQHPDVYVSPLKEPHFFIEEFRVERMSPDWRAAFERQAAAFAAYLERPVRGTRPPGIVTRWEDYLRLFAGARPGQAVGEGSIGCLWSATAARRIAERFPQARIFMILRDPAERAFSQYLHAATRRRVREPFGAIVRRAANGEHPPLHALCPILGFGAYAAQVARFLQAFPAHQVRIYLYEDFVAGPQDMLQDAFAHLGLAPAASLDLSQRRNEPRVPRLAWMRAHPLGGLTSRLSSLMPRGIKNRVRRLVYRPRSSLRLAPADRRFLVDYYAEDIQRLEAIVGRDLSKWLA